jgi:chromosome segregation ATPase
MSSAHVLNLGDNQPRQTKTEIPPVEDRFTQDKDLLEQTRADVRRMRIQVERQHDEHESHQQRTKILSIVLGVLFIFLVASLWVFYPTMRDQKKSMADMLGLQSLTSTLGGRMGSMQDSLKTLAGSLSLVAGRMDQLELKMKSNAEAVQGQAQQAGQRIREDVNRNMQAMGNRLSGVESNQKESAEHVAQLQQQIAGLQKDLVATREQASTATEQLKQLTDAQQNSTREITGLNQRVATSQTALSTLSNRVDRKRVDFDVQTRQKEQQIAPGIYLTVKHADTGKREIDGTLQVGASSQNITIRGVGILRPISFTTADDNRPIQFVLTDVAKDKVSGYLLMPESANSASR